MAVTAAQEQGFAILEERGVIAVSGDDKRTFLQGIVSNDVETVRADHAVWSAFLTPQGKYLHDFFMVEQGPALLLDCEAHRRTDLMRRLKLYKLRSKVELSDLTGEFAVVALFGEGAAPTLGLRSDPGRATGFLHGTAFIDPRLSSLGARALLPLEDGGIPGLEGRLEEAGFARMSPADYERLRLERGIPDGSRDLIVEKSILLENNFDELNGLSWTKGCYMGQELTARTKYRGLVRKRLMPVSVEGPLPEPGTAVTLDGKEIGEVRSGADGRALALLRIEEARTAHAAGRTYAAYGGIYVSMALVWLWLVDGQRPDRWDLVGAAVVVAVIIVAATHQ